MISSDVLWTNTFLIGNRFYCSFICSPPRALTSHWEGMHFTLQFSPCSSLQLLKSNPLFAESFSQKQPSLCGQHTLWPTHTVANTHCGQHTPWAFCGARVLSDLFLNGFTVVCAFPSSWCEAWSGGFNSISLINEKRQNGDKNNWWIEKKETISPTVIS